MTIKAVHINLEDTTGVQVVWARGTKKIDTRVRMVSRGKATLNEKFQMKTILEYDFSKGSFTPKPSKLQVYKGNQVEFLGETVFDLSRYGKTLQVTERLMLTDCTADPDACVEVAVRTKS